MTSEELEALADADTSNADNHKPSSCGGQMPEAVMRDLKPRLIL